MNSGTSTVLALLLSSALLTAVSSFGGEGAKGFGLGGDSQRYSDSLEVLKRTPASAWPDREAFSVTIFAQDPDEVRRALKKGCPDCIEVDPLPIPAPAPCKDGANTQPFAFKIDRQNATRALNAMNSSEVRRHTNYFRMDGSPAMLDQLKRGLDKTCPLCTQVNPLPEPAPPCK